MRSATRATALSGRCLHYGEGITFWPLVEALIAVGEPARAGARASRTAARRPRRSCSSRSAGCSSRWRWSVRWSCTSTICTGREPMLLDLLDHVVDLSRGAPILLLCTARPELLEDHPTWGGGKLNATTVLLEPLELASASAVGSARRRAGRRTRGRG